MDLAAAPRIREATADDWPRIWPIFRAVVAAGDSYAYPEDLDTDAAAALWLESPPGLTVVAVDEAEQIVGTAKMGPNRPGRGAHVATASFMVAPASRHRGVGRALGRYVVDWARSKGYRGIQFNAVVETNKAAVALWQELGFRIIGTVPDAYEHREHGRVGLHVMYLDLAASE
jgi:L-amino acid N-acyltransferase YncA